MNDKFGADIDAAVAGTPIGKKVLIAIGIQETFYIWAKTYKTGTPEQALGLCVGDTIDFPRRATAWPKNRAELEAHPKGKAMFKVARAALEEIAAVNSGYKTALKNPNKFCHGFGMFQHDIQFFKSTDPDYFLDGDWKSWKGTLGKGIGELKTQLVALYGPGKASLTHEESVYLAIAYNQGAKRTKSNMATKKYKQGHKDGNGVFYGEHIDANLKDMKNLF
ncbi:MAG: hypothetical protein EOS07_07485 [Mesorhizobium sp.]|nr:MAG: hypothetical protein EOS07_07485 [Mesorhizobium sp.]